MILEVGNYGFWKARMETTIKGIDPLAWKAVESGWTSPVQEVMMERCSYDGRALV